MAYPIRKEEAAWYAVARVFFPKENSGVDEEIRLDGKILRHLIVKVEDDEIFMTSEEIRKWNAAHLVKEEKEEEDDIIPIRKKPSSRSASKKEETGVEKEREESSEKQVSKDEIDRKIDEILEGTLISNIFLFLFLDVSEKKNASSASRK